MPGSKPYLTSLLRSGVTAATLLFILIALPVRADFISGQPADLTLGCVEPERMIPEPYGVAVDPVSGKVFVCDFSRHRILRFTSESALENKVPEAVLGQPDFESVNQGTTAATLRGPRGIAVDAGGRLWVADSQNGRVLRFDNAASLPSGAAASGVLGQPNFTIQGAGGAAENQMVGPCAVAPDSSGRLWVLDTFNHRVLRFDNAANRPNGANADAVLGQPAFGVNGWGTAADRMAEPWGIAVEEQNGVTVRLWVADTGNSRVLGFSAPASLPNGASADRLLGQTAWNAQIGNTAQNRCQYPRGVAVDGSGGLWVADMGNSRVLLFKNAGTKPIGGNADLVLGQTIYTTLVSSAGAGGLNFPTRLAVQGGRLWICDTWNKRIVRHENAAAKGNGNDADGVIGQLSLDGGRVFSQSRMQVAVDPVSGKLFVSDLGNNRVLRYASARDLENGSEPEAALGQPDLSSTTANTSASRMSGPESLAFGPQGQLWVADAGNNRVLRFDNAASLPTGAAASQVLGQTGFLTKTSALSATGMNHPTGLAVQWGYNPMAQPVARRLWVADASNNRVLRFDYPDSQPNGDAAVAVLGQPDFTTSLDVLTASIMNYPTGLAVDAATGTLWVSDALHYRVLRYDNAHLKANGAPASGVLLQPTHASAINDHTPDGLALAPNGRLFVTLGSKDVIVWFDNAAAKSNGAAWDGELGVFDGWGDSWDRFQQPTGCSLDPFTGRLWVADAGNRRVQRFTPALQSHITHAAFNAQNRFTLHIAGLGGEKFDIRSSTDLLNWDTVEGTQSLNGTAWQTLIWTAPAPPSGPKKFYRLKVP